MEHALQMTNTLEMLRALNKHLRSLSKNPAQSAGVLCHRQNLLRAQLGEAGLGASQVFIWPLNSSALALLARLRKAFQSTAEPGVCRAVMEKLCPDTLQTPLGSPAPQARASPGHIPARAKASFVRL